MGRSVAFAGVAVGAFVVTAVLWVAVQWFVFGDTECDRGQCGPMGEFAESAGLPGLVVIWAAIALAAAYLVVRRRRSS